MRLMSFSMTKDAFLDGTKTVTRRLGWKNLKVGDRLLAVEKAMGLRKGEKIKPLGVIEVVSAIREPLSALLREGRCGVEAEGFADLTPREFLARFCAAMRCDATATVTRIELVLRPGAVDSLAWLRGAATCSTGYMLEKIPVEFRRDDEFCEDLAREQLLAVERKEEFEDFNLDVSRLADALDELDTDDADQAFAQWTDAWADQEVDFHDVPDPRLPAFWTLAQCEALRWFCEQVPATPQPAGAAS